MKQDFLWWKDGVIYQIYPRSFADSNGDGIGDLQGIIQKLDYLADLGIDAIWLSPINPSPDVDFGYDVSNYKDIDPKFGSLADFLDLVEKAHQRGIRIIMDLVLNHSSDQHPWFVESRSSKDNPRRDWYIWRAGAGGGKEPPNNWQAIFGGKAWQYDDQTGEYYYHMFCKEQPDLNWRNPAVRAEMMDVFRFWADRGVDGFRLDVFNEYFKDAQFRNNPRKCGRRPFDRQIHIYDANQPEMMGVVEEIRSILDSYPERYAVGETFMSTPKIAADYCGPGKLHATFEFSCLWNPWVPERFLTSIRNWESELHEGAWPNYVMNNHDNHRSATRYNAAEDDEQLKVAAAMLLTVRGTPYLYYGEEIGMRDVRVPHSEMKDPVGLRYWPVPVGRDGCRSPMQWSGGKNAGFSNTVPWMRIHANYSNRNVEQQLATPGSLLNFYRNLLRTRKKHPALQRGSFTPLKNQSRQVMAYLRQHEDDLILVGLNFSPRPAHLVLDTELAGYQWDVRLSNKQRGETTQGQTEIVLQGFEALILIKK